MPRAYTTPSRLVVHFHQTLGSGQFGEAKAVVDRKGRIYCLKEIPVKIADECAMQTALTEVQMMKEMCHHPNVITFYESWFERNRMCILMEYAPNGSLDKLIHEYALEKKRFTMAKVRSFLEELSGALDYCHSIEIIHRDIKPGNILIDKLGSLKLADFGLARALDTSHLANTFCGSPLYMSPEQCVAGEQYSFPADVWAMGCVVFEIMALHSPWVTPDSNLKHIPLLIQRILNDSPNYRVLLTHGYKKHFVDAVNWMLQRDMSQRATASDIVHLLEVRPPPSSFHAVVQNVARERPGIDVHVAAQLLQRSFRASVEKRRANCFELSPRGHDVFLQRQRRDHLLRPPSGNCSARIHELAKPRHLRPTTAPLYRLNALPSARMSPFVRKESPHRVRNLHR